MILVYLLFPGLDGLTTIPQPKHCRLQMNVFAMRPRIAHSANCIFYASLSAPVHHVDISSAGFLFANFSIRVIVFRCRVLIFVPQLEIIYVRYQQKPSIFLHYFSLGRHCLSTRIQPAEAYVNSRFYWSKLMNRLLPALPKMVEHGKCIFVSTYRSSEVVRIVYE